MTVKIDTLEALQPHVQHYRICANIGPGYHC